MVGAVLSCQPYKLSFCFHFWHGFPVSAYFCFIFSLEYREKGLWKPCNIKCIKLLWIVFVGMSVCSRMFMCSVCVCLCVGLGVGAFWRAGLAAQFKHIALALFFTFFLLRHKFEIRNMKYEANEPYIVRTAYKWIKGMYSSDCTFSHWHTNLKKSLFLSMAEGNDPHTNLIIYYVLVYTIKRLLQHAESKLS